MNLRPLRRRHIHHYYPLLILSRTSRTSPKLPPIVRFNLLPVTFLPVLNTLLLLNSIKSSSAFRPTSLLLQPFSVNRHLRPILTLDPPTLNRARLRTLPRRNLPTLKTSNKTFHPLPYYPSTFLPPSTKPGPPQPIPPLQLLPQPPPRPLPITPIPAQPPSIPNNSNAPPQRLPRPALPPPSPTEAILPLPLPQSQGTTFPPTSLPVSPAERSSRRGGNGGRKPGSRDRGRTGVKD
jgi:hypothetical protein